jgi:hypothetical protein
MARSRIIPLIALILSCGVLINGCLNHSRLPSEGEERLIQQHSGVIVLFRLRTIVDGQPWKDIRLIGHDNKDRSWGFGFDVDIARLDPGQSPGLAIKRPNTALISPSDEARRQGWIYHVLPPGSYYLAVYDHEKKGTLPPGFILRVSGEKRLVYAGTLDIACKRGSWSWNPPSLCSGVSLTDEGDAAKVLAQSYFAQHGPISTSLMSKYDEAVAASQRPAIFPMGYVIAGTKDLVSPDWVKRGIARTTGIGAVPGEQIARAVLDGGAGLGLAYLLYLPVGATMGAISGKIAESKWRPCLEGLSREIDKIEPAAMLRPKLVQELTKYGPSQPVALAGSGDFCGEARRNGLKTVLQAEIQRIQLRECQERGSFCLELALQVRLWEANNHTLLQEKTLLYSNLHPYRTYSEKLPPYEDATWASSPCRRMEVY